MVGEVEMDGDGVEEAEEAETLDPVDSTEGKWIYIRRPWKSWEGWGDAEENGWNTRRYDWQNK